MADCLYRIIRVYGNQSVGFRRCCYALENKAGIPGGNQRSRSVAGQNF